MNSNTNRDTELLMIFVKNPVLGKVKTRLAKDIGDQKALEVYNYLLKYTRSVADQVECDKWVGYTWNVEENDLWNGFGKFAQEGDGLGERMELAFQKAFDAGYEKVCIIGSDCLDLNNNHLNEAFSVLNDNSIVIGPAKDGGYYLLGMKQLHSELFRNKQWSTDSVLPETIKDIQSLNLSSQQLETLSDVDNVRDLIGSDVLNVIGLSQNPKTISKT